MNRGGKRTGIALGLSTMVVITVAAPSCSSKSKAGTATLAQGCSLNSDCASPLICVFSLCHDACSESRDCPTDQRCVSVGRDNVCELPSESTCSATQPCPTGLLCWTDLQCRNPCDSLQPCVAGETCVDNVCFSPTESPDGGFPEAGGADGSPSDGSPKDVTSEPPLESAADAPFVPDPDAGVLGFTPSNFVPTQVDAGADWSAAVDANVTTSCTNCLPVTATTISQNDGSLADVYVLKSLVIAQTAGLRLTGPNPVILAVLGAVDIQGQLLVNGSVGTAGPGGFVAGSSPGPGAGEGPNGSADPDSNGGGGSYCGVGGAAGTSAPPAAVGGPTYGNATITPLVGGSAGGVSASYSSGGGAVQIVSGKSITVRVFGAINAGGGGSQHINGTGGGALSFDTGGADATANATPAAGGSPYGGAGSAGTSVDGSPGTSGSGANQTGGGGGAAGRIRINSASGSATITGIVSPDLSTSCATQGTLH
jgi:hypothetical protein